jgi:hypothetical protein
VGKATYDDLRKHAELFGPEGVMEVAERELTVKEVLDLRQYLLTLPADEPPAKSSRKRKKGRSKGRSRSST